MRSLPHPKLEPGQRCAAKAIKTAFGAPFEMMPTTEKLLTDADYVQTITSIKASL